MNDFCFFLSDINAGRLSENLKAFVLPGSLLAFEKKNGEPRPVSVGEIFYRLATGWSVLSSGSVISTILASMQMWPGMLGGVENLHLFLQALLCDSRMGHNGHRYRFYKRFQQ